MVDYKNDDAAKLDAHGWLRGTFDEGAAQQLIGKRVLVGLTYENGQGSVVEQKQFHGTVIEVSRKKGIVLLLANGGRYALPPDLRAFSPAAPGEYRLRSTGEVIADPDYLCTWTVTRREDR